jgi:hypothetical protein
MFSVQPFGGNRLHALRPIAGRPVWALHLRQLYGRPRLVRSVLQRARQHLRAVPGRGRRQRPGHGGRRQCEPLWGPRLRQRLRRCGVPGRFCRSACWERLRWPPRIPERASRSDYSGHINTPLGMYSHADVRMFSQPGSDISDASKQWYGRKRLGGSIVNRGWAMFSVCRSPAELRK